MPDSLFLDTNILVYLANEDSPFHELVLDKFKALASENDLWISRQVLREYAVVMTRSESVENPLSSEEVASDIKKWIEKFRVADETKEVTAKLLELIMLYNFKGKRIHDANIIATMMENNIQKLFTLNANDFKGIDGIELIAV